MMMLKGEWRDLILIVDKIGMVCDWINFSMSGFIEEKAFKLEPLNRLVQFESDLMGIKKESVIFIACLYMSTQTS